MAIKRKTVSVKVTRTVQVQQYQPSTIEVTETADVPEGSDPRDVKDELYKSASASVVKFMNAEIKKYSEE